MNKTEENRKMIKDFLYDVMQGNHLEKIPDYIGKGLRSDKLPKNCKLNKE